MSKMLGQLKYIISALIFVLPQAAIGSPVTWYKDPEIRVSFAYSEKFKPESPAEQSTRFLVNWRTKKSRNLMATCFLKAFPTVGDDAEARYQLKINPEERVQAFVNFEREAGRKASLISYKNIKIDDLDGLYFVIKVSSETFDKKITMDVHHVLTFWDGYQVVLFCGTALAYQLVGQASEKTIAKVVKNVEAEIMKVLRSLHFDRN